MSFRFIRSALIATAVSVGLLANGASLGLVDSAIAQPAPASFADLAERLSPAVVNISTAQKVQRPQRPMPNIPKGSPFERFFKDFFDGQGNGAPRSVQSLGSGFVIDAEGYIVTNNHVIENADDIDVVFQDGTTLEAQLIGRDPKTDLAVLKVEAEKPLEFVNFGDSDSARVGDWVLAIGNPFGLGGSVSAGIISARNRNIDAGPYDDFLQTDAAINRGNSGGPLFNMNGDVIGVNTAIISPSGGSIGIGFSVPANIARNVVEQLREFGRTRRGWLGVKIQVVDDNLAEALNMDKPHGALVAGIDEDGPAEEAGLHTGDVIVRFNGQDIEHMRDLPRIVASTSVGATVPVEVLRQDVIEHLEVTIGLLKEDVAALTAEKPDSKTEDNPEQQGYKALGMVFDSLTPALRRQFDVSEDTKGVLVIEVDPASSAFERGVRVGDVIAQVSQRDVSTLEAVEEEIETARTEGRRSVLLMVNRKGSLRFVAVEFDS